MDMNDRGCHYNESMTSDDVLVKEGVISGSERMLVWGETACFAEQYPDIVDVIKQFPPLTLREEAELANLAMRGDREAAGLLTLALYWLIFAFSLRFTDSSSSLFRDYFSEGMLAVLKTALTPTESPYPFCIRAAGQARAEMLKVRRDVYRVQAMTSDLGEFE